VFEAAEGRQALAHREIQPVDLAIVDLGMPGMNGLELLALLAGDPARPTPAIAFTASGADAGEAARAAGAALVLRKPVSAAELRQALATVLPDQARVSPGSGPAEDDEMFGLVAAARTELIRRIPGLVSGVKEGQASLASEAHQIAGLAAQFGWPAIAEAADTAERSLRAGQADVLAAAALAAALAALTDQNGDAATASR
jgi:CheY-like chemotaxis protein